MNDDIIGAKPKAYAIGNSIITNSFAGVSTGIQERLKERDAPWGVGGNLDSTSYGQRWLDKTEK